MKEAKAMVTRACRWAAVSLALGGAEACAGLDTGNGDLGHVDVALTIDDTAPVDKDGHTFTLDAVSIHVREVRLGLPDGTACSDELSGCSGDTITVAGPWDVDLVHATATPALPTIAVPLGTLRRIDIRFDPNDATDLTLTATGTTTYLGQPTPFRLALKFDEATRFESAAGVALTGSSVKDVVLRLDPSAWFADLPLQKCAEQGDLPIVDGTIVLEDGHSSCSDVENTIRDAIKASGRIE